MDLRTQRAVFRWSSELTDHVPRLGARLLDAVLHAVATHPGVEARLDAHSRHALARLEHPRRIALLSDIHLGDAVMLQSMVTALRDFFPWAEVHYVVARSAACLLQGNPEITELRPLYAGSPTPSADDMAAVARLCREGGYDLVVNSCPSFARGRPIPRELPTLDLVDHASHLVRNEMHPFEPGHLLFQSNLFVRRALATCFRPVRHRAPRGVRLALPEPAFESARAFLASLAWPCAGPLVLVNPDAASRFTRPPDELLVPLAEALARRPCRLLVAEGHTDPGAGRRLVQGLSAVAASRARLASARLDVPAFAALTDLVDAFVSGDTGPLHWAAARKRSLHGRVACRNRTFVVSLFGATPAMLSGYDSFRPGFLPAWQDAPSITLASAPPCRNISCLNKLHKTCRVARCFEGLDAGTVADSVLALLGPAQRSEPALAGV